MFLLFSFMKRGLVFLFLFLFCWCISLSSSGFVGVDFNVGGCSFNFNTEDGPIVVGVNSGTCSRDTDVYGTSGEIVKEYATYGLFYCGGDGEYYYTKEVGLGCAMGNADYDHNNNENFCCPEGYVCNEVSTGNFICNRSINNCDYDNKPDCNDAGFIWFEDECVCNIKDLGCADYGSPESCADDEFNLSVNGVGAEFCGSTIECNGKIYSISDDECSCMWNGVAGRCQTQAIGRQYIIEGDGSSGLSSDVFSFSTFYELGECVEGKQDVNWDIGAEVIDGFEDVGGVPEGCTDLLTGGNTRLCGEPVIKLPGFSLFALFASMIIIGLYYCRRSFR